MPKHYTKNYLITKFNFILFFLLLVILNGCLSIKPATKKSGKKYFETFYVGEEGTQYFIKPIIFENKELHEKLNLDITFRYKNEIKDSATVNMSITGPTLYKTIDSIEISNKTFNVKSDKVNLLFNEKNKKELTSRYSTKLHLKEVKKIFNNAEWTITLYNKKGNTKYKTKKKTVNSINAIKNKVFIIM